jgi:hypothetical protein
MVIVFRSRSPVPMFLLRMLCYYRCPAALLEAVANDEPTNILFCIFIWHIIPSCAIWVKILITIWINQQFLWDLWRISKGWVHCCQRRAPNHSELGFVQLPCGSTWFGCQRLGKAPILIACLRSKGPNIITIGPLGSPGPVCSSSHVRIILSSYNCTKSYKS